MDFVRPSRSVALRFVSGRGHYDTVIDAVRTARTSVWIATANLKELMVEDLRWSVRRRRRGASYRSIIEIFDELVAAGVEIRVLHAGAPSRPFREELARHPRLASTRRAAPRDRSSTEVSAVREPAMLRASRRVTDPRTMPPLRKPVVARMSDEARRVLAPLPVRASEGPFEMRLCPRVHLKAVVVDGEFLYLGSANWTGAGLGAKGVGRRNFELGVVTDDALLLDDVQEIIDRIWRGAACTGCRLRDACPNPLDGTAHRPVGRRKASG